MYVATSPYLYGFVTASHLAITGAYTQGGTSLFATLEAAWTSPNNGLDVAFFKTTSGYTMTNQTIYGDTLSSNIYYSTYGTSVYMAGAASGFRQSGIISSTSTTLYVYNPDGSITIWNDMGTVSGWAENGDSGGVIYTTSNATIVGIVVGGFGIGSGEYYYTQAQNILLDCDILPY